MSDRWLDREHPWFPFFLVGAGAMVAAFTALAIVLFWVATDSSGDADSAADATSTATALSTGPTRTPTPEGPVVYQGIAPPGLAASDFAPALPGERADILFVDEAEAVRLATGYYVPIAAMGAGVDALSADQLAHVLAGSITDWAEVGGIAGPIVVAAAGPAEDQSAIATLVSLNAAVSFPTYEELRAAMTMDSGIVAMVPLDEVRVEQTAIAIDGMDLVRGYGSPLSWPYAEFVTVVALTADGEEGLAELQAEYGVEVPTITTVIATGDILMSRCSLQRIIDSGDWASALRGPVADYLASADLTIGSVDGSIQDINEQLLCFDHVNLSSPPEVMEAFTVAGIDSVTVATNHIFDCGVAWCGNRAFLRTLELFDEAGIAAVGGGNNLEEALAPAVFEINGVSFGVLGFDDVAAMELEATADAPGTAPLDDSYDDERATGQAAFWAPAENLGVERLSQTIRDVAESVDVVIVQVQSGIEDTHNPSPRSIKALRAAVESGSVLVVGNHPHHAQAVESGEDWFLAYALGNFIYDQTRLEGHKQGFILEATFWGADLRNVRLVPYEIEDLYRPVMAEGELRAKILNDVFTASLALP